MKANTLSRLMMVPLMGAALLLPVSALAGEHYVEVSGNGEVKAWPDFITLSLNVSASAADAASAKQQLDEQMQQLLSLSDGFNIAREDVDASRINRQPLWHWNDGSREYRGEQISRPVTLTLRDTSQYAQLSHDMMAIKGLSLNGQSMGFADRRQLEQQAMTLALHDARDKAQQMAKALDSDIDGVLRIEEQGGMATPMVMEGRAFAMAKSEPAPMLIQQQTISTSVRVRFALDD